MPTDPPAALPALPDLPDLPDLPAEGDLLPGPAYDPAVLRFLAGRRSTKVIHLAAPGPDRPVLDRLLQLAMRVPDHGKLGPWRWVIVAGQARERVGAAMAQVLAAATPDADPGHLTAETDRWLRAPVIAVLVSAPVTPHRIPVWEQELGAGALAQNLLCLLQAAGYGACWLTGWNAYDPGAARVLGLAPGERIAALISIGTATTAPQERVRPDLPARISWL